LLSSSIYVTLLRGKREILVTQEDALLEVMVWVTSELDQDLQPELDNLLLARFLKMSLNMIPK